MKTLVINTPFLIAEELLDNAQHLINQEQNISEEHLIHSIGKTATYVKKALRFLQDINILEIIPSKGEIKLNESIKDALVNQSIPAPVLIKRTIVNFPPFNYYFYLLQTGKSEKVSARFTITKYNLTNNEDQVKSLFQSWLKYLDKDLSVKKKQVIKINTISKNQFFWFSEEGSLMFDEEGYTKKLIETLNKTRINNQYFVDPIRLSSLETIKSKDFDLRKLIRICEEINSGFRIGNYYSVGILIRAVLDHVPPIFNKKTFSEVANNYGSKSFKDSMMNLENFSRKVADGFMHSHIRRAENLPNPSTIDCKNVFDILLGEIIVILTPTT